MLSKKFTAVAGAAAAAADDYFKNTTLLLSGDGTNGAQNNTFTDSSTNNFTITRNGNTTQGTFSPYSPAGSSWSNYFDGSGDYIDTPSTGQFAPTGDFTIGAWFFVTSVSATRTIISNYTGNNSTDWEINVISSSTINIYTNGATLRISSSTGAVVLNQWNYVALTRSGTTITGYLNGSSIGTYTQSGTFGSASKKITIGAEPGGAIPFAGYLSNVILIDGSAVSSVPTTPSTAVSGTKLLICNNNRFVDSSASPNTLTIAGDVSVQRFNPFNPTEAYSTSTVGGSGYFDDSGDYLTTSSSAISYTGDFCIECWFYTNTTKTYACIYSDENTGVGGTILLNNGSNNGQITVYCGSISNFASTSTGLNNNAWHHVAFTRSGSTVRLFIDGQLENTTTASGTITTPSTFRIGTSFFSNRDFLGYISGFRCVSGSAVYTSAFTPPTSPPTAITNTSLLLNFTNAGIYDSAMMNDLETVGNAQISTSTKKYGTGSMYFDGTGDYLKFLSTPDTRFGSGDFTIEGWIQSTSISTTQAVLERRSSLAANGIAIYLDASKLSFRAGDSNTTAWEVIIDSGTLSSNVWYHFALTRSGSTWKAFIDGTQVGSSVTWSGTIDAETSNWLIGIFFDASGGLNGYLDDIRITKGYARYTANFTAPTAALPNY